MRALSLQLLPVTASFSVLVALLESAVILFGSGAAALSILIGRRGNKKRKKAIMAISFEIRDFLKPCFKITNFEDSKRNALSRSAGLTSRGIETYSGNAGSI